MTFRKLFFIELLIIAVGLIALRLFVGTPARQSVEANIEPFVKSIVHIPPDASPYKETPIYQGYSWIDGSTKAKISVQWLSISATSHLELIIRTELPKEKYLTEGKKIMDTEVFKLYRKDQMEIIRQVVPDNRVHEVTQEISDGGFNAIRKFDSKDGLLEIRADSAGVRMYFDNSKIQQSLGDSSRKLSFFLPPVTQVNFSLNPLHYVHEIVGELIVLPFSQIFSPNLFSLSILVVLLLPIPITILITNINQRFQTLIWANIIFFLSFWLLAELQALLIFILLSTARWD